MPEGVQHHYKKKKKKRSENYQEKPPVRLPTDQQIHAGQPAGTARLLHMTELRNHLCKTCTPPHTATARNRSARTVPREQAIEIQDF